MATTITFDEAIQDLEMATEEFLTHLAGGEWPDEMPDDLPATAQVLWTACKQIQIELMTEDFEEFKAEKS
jgi:hypothetical protein